MKRIGLWIFALALLFSGVRGEEMVACTLEYAPMCGQPPMAECPAGMACPQVMPAPKTYGNMCGLKADKAEFLYTGECEAPINLEDTAPVACTKEYAPVCGAVEIQCIKAPCYHPKQTYSNVCTMNAENAYLLYAGQCKVEGPLNNKAYPLIVKILDTKFEGKDYNFRYQTMEEILAKVQNILITSLMTPRQAKTFSIVHEGLEIYRTKNVLENFLKSKISEIAGKTDAVVDSIKWTHLMTAQISYSAGNVSTMITVELSWDAGKLSYKLAQ